LKKGKINEREYKQLLGEDDNDGLEDDAEEEDNHEEEENEDDKDRENEGEEEKVEGEKYDSKKPECKMVHSLGEDKFMQLGTFEKSEIQSNDKETKNEICLTSQQTRRRNQTNPLRVKDTNEQSSTSVFEEKLPIISPLQFKPNKRRKIT